MADITVLGMFLTGDHASRPAATAVGKGSLYSCSDHSLIYQSDASSWATWATLGSVGGSLTVDGDSGDGPVSSVDTIVFDGATITDDTGGQVTVSGLGGSGGAAPIAPMILATYAKQAANSTSVSTTITAAAIGDRIVVVVGSYARDVNTPTCTNVTFTEVGSVAFSTTIYLSVYVGVVSGGASGTTVQTTATGSNWLIQDVYVVDDTLAPTAGTPATMTNTSAQAVQGTAIGTISPDIGTFFVIAAAQNDGSTGFTSPTVNVANALMVAIAPGSNAGMVSAIGRTGAASVIGFAPSSATNGADFASIIVPIT